MTPFTLRSWWENLFPLLSGNHKMFRCFGGIFTISVICCITLPMTGQKVTVSEEINIKLDNMYDIFPDVEGNILLYHHRGQEHIFDVFDENLRLVKKSQVNLDFKGVDVINIVKADTLVNLFFQWKDEKTHRISQLSVDRNGDMVDTINVLFAQEKIFMPNIKCAMSLDKKTGVLFWTEGRFFHYLKVTNEKVCKVLESGKIENKEFNFKSDFKGLLVSNEGKIYILGKKERTWNKSDEFLMVVTIYDEQYELNFLTLEGWDISQVKFKYDEVNRQLCLGGLISKGDDDAIVGYFMRNFTSSPDLSTIVLEPQLFSMEFMSEVYGKKSAKVKKISDVYLEHLVVRQDGGVLLVLEIQKEFLRRAGPNAMNRIGDVYSGRGFIDYYHEDLILINNHPDGKEHWKKVLFKKQFSQDDNAIYSSYFLFMMPSRIKIVYNDEIKTNNTVSEYVVDPLGNFERKSVLSTQYQNLKLRFQDAIQISNRTIIVPSENMNRLNLVKIDFEL